MGKIDDNKQQKLTALYDSAFELFLSNGIERTSIQDISKNAGVAKGTFYLYFNDKYEIRDLLIARTASKLFRKAYDSLKLYDPMSLEDKIVFIVDYVLDYMCNHKDILRFISKNLSWGIFESALTKNPDEVSFIASDIQEKLFKTESSTKLRAPKTMLFLIIELASSTSYSTILDNDPISFEELKPYLNESIRMIIRNHTVSE